MTWVLVVLVVCVMVFLGFLVSWWPVLDDPNHFIQLRMEEEETFRFFADLPKPDREWNR